MDLHLHSRVYLVVGGTGYIGGAIARRLELEGATAVAASRHPAGDGGILLDAADPASVQAGVAEVLRRFGRLDGLVVTAAPSLGTLDASRSSDPAQVLEAFEGKAVTFLRLANEVIPVLRSAGFGRIVGISGQVAYISGNIAGSVRNTALNIMAKNLADSLAGTGVTVNTVNPAVVDDEPAAAVKPGAGGASSPQQIADLVAFLLSPLSTTSGEAISIGHRMLGVTHS